jgi:hypothetical protein
MKLENKKKRFFKKVFECTKNAQKYAQKHCNAFIKYFKPYLTAGFKPTVFCSGGGRENHCATPPGNITVRVG